MIMTLGFFEINKFPNEEAANKMPPVASDVSLMNCLRELINSVLVLER
jgi:hypothetical protein